MSSLIRKISVEELNKLESILIVDDDPVTCFLQVNLIRESGYTGTLHDVYHAEAALAYLAENRSTEASDSPGPMLILLDIKMPFVDGFEFLKKLSLEQKINREKLHIAILTTSISKRDYSKASKFSIADFLVKPLTEDKLSTLIKSLPLA
nr:response regulator [Cesiribacter sp. SM1]